MKDQGCPCWTAPDDWDGNRYNKIFSAWTIYTGGFYSLEHAGITSRKHIRDSLSKKQTKDTHLVDRKEQSSNAEFSDDLKFNKKRRESYIQQDLPSKQRSREGCIFTTHGAVFCTAIQAVIFCSVTTLRAICDLAICLSYVLSKLCSKKSRQRIQNFLLLGFPNHSRLRLMALIVFLRAAPACGQATTCTAGHFTAGDTATVVCEFPDDIKNHHIVYVQYFPASTPSAASGTEVFSCKVKNVTSSRCGRQDGYNLKGHTRNTVSVALPNVTVKAAGQYICQFLPHDGSPRDRCTLTVLAKPGGVTPVSADSTSSAPHQDHLIKQLTDLNSQLKDMTTLLVVILAVLILAIPVILLVIKQGHKLCTKRNSGAVRQRTTGPPSDVDEYEHIELQRPIQDENINS